MLCFHEYIFKSCYERTYYELYFCKIRYYLSK